MSKPGTPNAPDRITLPDVLMFLLELALWGSFFWIGWVVGDSFSRWIFALLLGIGVILIWVVFRTPGMQRADKGALFPTPGPVRLVLEVGLFLIAGAGLWAAGYRWAAETLWTFAVLIYVLSFPRIRWLLEH